MTKESKLQGKIVRFLESKGAVVLTIQPTAGIPQGFPDMLGLLDGGGFVALEVKKENPYKRNGTAKAGAFRPLQQRTVALLNDYYFARVVYPENWEKVKKELLEVI